MNVGNFEVKIIDRPIFTHIVNKDYDDSILHPSMLDDVPDYYTSVAIQTIEVHLYKWRGRFGNHIIPGRMSLPTPDGVIYITKKFPQNEIRPLLEEILQIFDQAVRFGVIEQLVSEAREKQQKKETKQGAKKEQKKEEQYWPKLRIAEI